jgi:hypothetical protein
MQYNVFFLSSLRRDVALDFSFASMTSDGTDVVPVGPEFSSPEVFLDRGHFMKYFPGGNTFDRPDNPGWTVGWNRLYEEIHVIAIGADFQESNLIAKSDLKADISERLIHLCREDSSPILRGAHDMIQQNRNIMATMKVLTHASGYITSARQAAGYLPVENKFGFLILPAAHGRLAPKKYPEGAVEKEREEIANEKTEGSCTAVS